MKGSWLMVSGFLLFLAAAGGPAQERFLPYQVQKRTLSNGLDVLVIEMPEFKGVVSYNMLVLAGARNEIEKGKTGLAHLFEHILFRHRWKGEVNGYDRAINQLGAFDNAWTNFDATFYHPFTFASNLKPSGERPGLAELQADRFVRLDFTEEIFKTEAGAVLGEYRRIASNPQLKMSEELLAMAFPNHSYGHTTIGYLEDIKDMPNEYQAALDFYNNYYRPNNVVLIVAGDVKAAEIFQLAEQLYGDWQPQAPPEIPDPGPVGGPKSKHVEWEADVPPRIFHAYRVPAFRSGSVETAVGQLLPQLLASETAPLFQKLRYQKKSASELELEKAQYESFDDRLVILSARLFKEQYESKGKAYLDEVIADMEAALEELKNFSRQKDAARILDEYKSKYRYDLLASLDSPANIAETLAWYYRFDRDPAALDKLVASVEKLTPRDVEAYARKYFVPANRVTVTMAPAQGAAQ